MSFKKSGGLLVTLASLVTFSFSGNSLAGDTPASDPAYAHGRFENVHVYMPKGGVNNVAVYAPDSSGWRAEDMQNATALTNAGVMVIALDTAQFFKAMEEDEDDCEFPDGDVENLSHFLQAYFKLPSYKLPFLMGSGNGAAFAFATLSQAPTETFAGLVTVDFCQELQMKIPICEGDGLKFSAKQANGFYTLLNTSKLIAPWHTVTSATPNTCAVQTQQNFKALPAASAQADSALIISATSTSAASTSNKLVEAYKKKKKTAITSAPNTSQALQDLPLELVPSTKGDSEYMALFLSGDGGWAGLDKEVADAMAAQGIPVVGWDSLRYFWTARTPEGIAADAQRIITYYLQHWNKEKVVILGYSQGANVMPFMLNHLPKQTQKKIDIAVMMGLEEQAAFEFHMTNWVSESEGTPIAPEIEKLPAIQAVCYYGAEDDESACPKLNPKKVKAVKLEGGHHFDGNYEHLAKLIIDAARSAQH